ncbi:MAG: response regulator [Proteobacteria bacterium]|nr:response regulator [Pseudomonadota bacterium]
MLKDEDTNTTSNLLTDIDFKTIFESTPTPHLVICADPPKFTIMAATDSYLRVVNRTRSNLIGISIFDAFPENPADVSTTGLADLRLSFERILKTGKTDVLGLQRYDIPTEINGKAEFKIKYWSPINVPIIDKKHKVAFILHRVEDVTDYVLLKQFSNAQLQNQTTLQDQNDQRESEIFAMTRKVKTANRNIKQANEALALREKELAKLNERLKELDQAKTTFFSNISHEFRTPLTLMLSPVEELLNSDLPNSIRNNLTIVHRNTLRLLKLVNSLLDFSRIEAGRMQVSFQACDLATITKELASHFYSAVEKAGLEYVIDCPPLPEKVYVDPDLWEKIVLNLISNAFKYTFRGKIAVSLHWHKDSVVLKVQDTGIGIANKDIKHIFDRFYRATNVKSRTHEGSGIGLALVKELVNIHGGSIKVKSVEGNGSTFTVLIPTGSAHLPDVTDNIGASDASSSTIKDAFTTEALSWLPEENAESATGPTVEFSNDGSEFWLGLNPSEFKKAVVLLVDDNIDMRNYIKKLLLPFCEVRTASNGKEALDAIELAQPDLVLCDVMMPVMNGFELLTAVRSNSDFQFIPFILLTARAGEDAKVEGFKWGADDYLTKPFSVRELLVRVKRSLQRHRARFLIETDLRKISSTKSQFISNLSHELRTPLNAIIGYSELMIDGIVKSPDKTQTYLKNISEAGHYLLNLINDILDHSKIDAGKFSLNMERIEIASFIADIQNLLKNLANKKQVTLNVKTSIDYVEADRIRLKQILINLISNAIKYNHPNGNVDILIKTSDDHKWVIFEIKDSGIGIPEDKLNNLFTEFYQTNIASPDIEGTGLGLALCKRLVELHGGLISITSQIDHGTTVIFKLPTFTSS